MPEIAPDWTCKTLVRGVASSKQHQHTESLSVRVRWRVLLVPGSWNAKLVHDAKKNASQQPFQGECYSCGGLDVALAWMGPFLGLLALVFATGRKTG